MGITVLERPAVLSISVAFLKQNKRILHNLEDDLVQFWIQAAEDYIEKATNTALMQQRLKLDLDAIYPVIKIPRPPLVSIEKITTVSEGVSTDADLTGLDTSFVDRMLTKITVPGIDQIAAGRTSIEYTAGYAVGANVPFALRQAVMLLASHWFTSREAAFMDKRIMDVEKSITFGVDEIIKQYRIPNVQGQFEGSAS